MDKGSNNNDSGKGHINDDRDSTMVKTMATIMIKLNYYLYGAKYMWIFCLYSAKYMWI